MKLSLADIDPGIAEQVAKATGLAEQAEAAAKADRSRRIADMVKAGAITAWLEAGALALAAGVGGAGGSPAALATFYAVVLGIPVAAGAWCLRRAGRRPLSAEQQMSLPRGDEDWRILAGTARLSGAQKSYLDAVVALVEAAEGGRIEEARAGELLAELNGLAASDRALLAQQQDLARLTTADDPKRLAKERESLAARRDAAADPTARATLEQSLTLLDERIAHASELSPLWERVGAQREVVAQTLHSLASALLRLKVGPRAADQTAPAAEAERAGDMARDILQQTRAVERAVSEVVTLRGGGA